jgi:hypothetical protein
MFWSAIYCQFLSESRLSVTRVGVNGPATDTVLYKLSEMHICINAFIIQCILTTTQGTFRSISIVRAIGAGTLSGCAEYNTILEWTPRVWTSTTTAWSSL